MEELINYAVEDRLDFTEGSGDVSENMPLLTGTVIALSLLVLYLARNTGMLPF